MSMMTDSQPSTLTHALIPTSDAKLLKFGDSPVLLACHYCGHEAHTTLNYQSGVRAWITCGGLCALGCWFGCCLLPFCMESLQEPQHLCTHCKKVLNFGKRSNT